MDWLPTLLALLVTAAVAWYAYRPQYVFVVQLGKGLPRMTKGKLTAAFLRELQEVCKEFQLSHGWVAGVRKGKRIALEFSSDLPPPLRQRLRNLWMFHG